MRMFHIAKTSIAKESKGQYAQRISKIKRNSGQEYCTKNGKIISEKKFENKNCICSKKCVERINEAERKIIFQQFWNMSDFDIQNLFLYESVHSYPVKRRRSRNYAGTLRSV